ncbi:MAG: Crp/Fnr family transcriptional regulator [Bacteroidota bacterium]|nr:Crp/Fnr family transcriptional regulator [Bacteroidota bacterium]
MQKINETRYEVKFNRGETIFKQGTSLTHIACVTSGLIKVYIEGFNNKNLILKIVRPGNMIGGPGMYTDFRHHFSATAVEDTTACFIDASLFNEILKKNITLANELLRQGNERDIMLFDKLLTLTQKQMPGRMANTLLYLNKAVYRTNPFYLTISRQDLADLSSMTKESVIRIIKDFKDAGFISVNKDEVKILNEKALISISETG